jgi:dCMP deaminase
MYKWDSRYLEVAKNISTWSKDPSTKIGAIIIGNRGQIVSQGYNGFPANIKDTQFRLNNREEKYKYVIHAEMNCIYNACHSGISLQNTSLYVYGLPDCSECAKGVIQVGIKKVIMQHAFDKDSRWEEHYKLTKSMFDEVGIISARYDLEGNII